MLYGAMLSEKYASDFLKGLEMIEKDGAKKLYGEGRITPESSPDGFHGDAANPTGVSGSVPLTITS